MRYLLVLLVLLAATTCQAQYPIWLGQHYNIPAGAYGPVDTGGWYYTSPATPRQQICVPGAGCYAIRDARDLKMLQANLRKRGISTNQAVIQPQIPACPNGQCKVGGQVQFILGGQ